MQRFHVIGNWVPGSISCGWAPSSFRPAPAVQELIERTWAEAKQRLGDRLFDGPMCRLESYEQSGSRLHLTFSPISYKPFLGTNLHHAELAEEYGRAALANPVGASCALIAADGPLMMGRRNNRVAYYPNRVHPFAGALEPRDPMDVFNEIRRELAEELALDHSHIAEIRCLGIAEDRSLRQPELIFLVRCTLGREQIARQLDHQEHHACYIVEATPEAAEAALREVDLLTPIGMATIRLWAHNAFGADRFPVSVGR